MPDGTTTPVRLFPGPDEAPRHRRVSPAWEFPPATTNFAEELVSRGFNAAIGELRGQGDSRPRPSSASTYGYHELVALDFPAIFEVVRERFPAATPFLLGHSMGGVSSA